MISTPALLPMLIFPAATAFCSATLAGFITGADAMVPAAITTIEAGCEIVASGDWE